MARLVFLFVLALVPSSLTAGSPWPPGAFFGIEVVDQDTLRGVPLVRLETTSGARYYTDSAGLVAFYEPGLMNQKVWFEVSSPGYEFAKDGFGLRGVALQTTPGTVSRLKIKRLNVAERLYRITGQGIYRDSVLLGRKTPIAHPLLNASVTGQDSVLTAIYRGKLYWLYGDTSRLSYGLGNFAMSGATTDLPERIDPSVGIDLSYFVGKDDFSRPMAPMKGEGVVWLSGLMVIPDESGRERMIAWFERRRGLGAVLENGFVAYNDQENIFEKMKNVPLAPRLVPQGNPFRATNDAHIYFTRPYPALRVKADWRSCLDLTEYEGFTCLKAGTPYQGKGKTQLDRDSSGQLIWAWKPNTPPLTPQQQEDLIQEGALKREQSPFRLEDPDTGKPIQINSSSCFWNNYRKCYIMIACQVFGATMLGEIWYSEAPSLEGPWVGARKIITHMGKKDDAHDFYNPTQHPFFDQDGGRFIYLEGTYANTFSGNPSPTPYYEYNQIMYRLDLSDHRLR